MEKDKLMQKATSVNVQYGMYITLKLVDVTLYKGDLKEQKREICICTKQQGKDVVLCLNADQAEEFICKLETLKNAIKKIN